MTLPDMKSTARLDVSEFRKGTQDLLTDLRAIYDLGKKLGTIRITSALGQGVRDTQTAMGRLRASINEAIPTDMQNRIDSMFGGFNTNAARSAAVFEQQGSRVALLNRQIDDLNNAIRITRSEFQSGIGEATPEETAQLTLEMRRLKGVMEALRPEIKATFGEWSTEAVKAANATRTAEATIAAANGQISRLGLASQVKLGASAALAQFAPMAGGAANGLIQLAKASDTARLSNVFFEKQLTRNNVQISEGRKQVDLLSGAFNVMPNVTEEAIKVLLRNNYSLSQATEAMKLYAGSALAVGKDVGGAWSALADDVQRGSTIMSNQYGITANIISAQNQYAKQIGVTSAALTDQQKVEGFLVALRKESTQELQDADTILKGYAGSAGQANMELQRAGRDAGQNLMPLLTQGTRALVGLLNIYNALPKPVRDTTTILLASAVAVGVLAVPVTGLAGAYGTLVTARAASAAASTIETAATTRLNVVTTIQRVLLLDVGKAYWAANSAAMGYSGGMGVATAATTTVNGALTGLVTTVKAVAAVTSIFTVAALAAGAAGYAWGKAVEGTTQVYQDMDTANQAAFDKTMGRISELRKAGTELGRAQARVLTLQLALSQAQQGELVGVNALTGERIYSKPDEARIKQLQADLEKAKGNVTALFTEAQRRGQLNLTLTKDQTDAVKELNKVLEGRQFDLKLTGLSDMGRDLAKLGQEFDSLREKFKKPFVVNGQLLDPAQTPALRAGLEQLDAALLAEQQATRKKYANQAVKTAREAALSAQAAEISAMQEGAAKRSAERQAEIEQIRADTAEKAKALADFPAQQQEIESAARRTIAAKRRAWAAEDTQLAKESIKRVQDAEKSARDARIASMADGLAKEEAIRAAALVDLRASIAAQVEALKGDPRAQAGVQAAGNAQYAALVAQQARERAQAVEAANQQVLDSEKSTRDALIGTMSDGAAKEEAIRAASLSDLRSDVKKRVDALKDYPTQQARVQAEGNRQILALEQQQGRDRLKAQQDAGKLVSEASRAARDAEMAAIQDEAQRTRAQREREVQDVRDSVQKRLDALKDYPKLQAQALVEGQRQLAALQEKFNQEDEAKAREHARTMALAWAAVREAQFGASQATRGAGDAEFELQLSRRLAAVRGNAVEVARIEQEGQQERARRAQVNADAQFAEDKRRLLEKATLDTSADKITEGEKRTIWAKYYADLGKLDSDYQAGNRARLKDSEEQAQQTAETLRQARLAEANRPVSASETRVQELQWARDLAQSDAEVLRLNQGISQERAGQISALQAQLDGVNGLTLTAEERQQVESHIKTLQHDQAAALREQQQTQQQLMAATLARLEAEATYSEKTARTDADLLSARLNSLNLYRTQLVSLDTQLAGEGRAAERNALLQQRLDLLGKIDAKQAEIDAMPGEAEQRRAQALQAQRGYLLQLVGLNDNALTQAQERVRVAQEEVDLSRLKVAQARTQAERETAATEAMQRGTALLSANAELVKARNQQEGQALDILEARARAELQLRDLADDAVATAQLDLDVTRQRLALVREQLAAGGLSQTDQLALQRQQIDLTAQQAAQERTLSQTQRDRATLLRGLSDAQRTLNTELDGSARRATPLQTAFQGMADARLALARAEEAYNEAQASGKPEQVRSATEALTGAIRGQRDAVAKLADTYRSQLSSMDSLRDAADRLNKVVYGDQGRKYDFNTEFSRLQAIQTRRDAAQMKLTEALQGGNADLISKAADELAKQEERYGKQADLMEKNGSQITRTGEAQSRRLADQVDALGIQYDREAVALQQRADIADQEAQAVMTLSGIVSRWEASNETLSGKLTALQLPSAASLAPSSVTASIPGLRELVAVLNRPVSATAPAVTSNYTLSVGGITINASSDKAPDIRRAVQDALNERVSEAQRAKTWGDVTCKPK